MSLMEAVQNNPIHISRMTTLPLEYVREKFQSFLKEDHSEAVSYTHLRAHET